MHTPDNSKTIPADDHIKPARTGIPYIQTGAWTKEEYAKEALSKLSSSYPGIYMIKEGRYNKVRIPASASYTDNSRILKDLKEKFNIKPVLVNKSK